MKKMTTSFDDKCQVVSDFTMTYIDDIRFADFIETNDLGIAFAIGIAQDMVVGLTPEGKEWVNRTYDELLEVLQLSDNDFTTLEKIEDATGLYPVVAE